MATLFRIWNYSYMRQQTRQYLTEFLESHKGIKNLLEVGSKDVSGSIRNIVEKREIKYTGIDMMEGENVDIVANAHNLCKAVKYKKYDVVVCFDTFEHDNAFWITLDQIKRTVKKGGWMMLGFPSRYCPEHSHPNDYWRFMPQSMDLMFEGWKNYHKIVDKNGDTEDEIYGWGQRP